MTALRVVIGSTLVVAFLVWPTRLTAEITKAAARKAAPDFTLHDATNAPRQLSAHKGEVVLLDFWATWCTGCKVEIPWFMEFAKKYKDKGLAAVGVAMDDEGWTMVKPYLEQHPINYPIVVGDAELAKRYGISELPVTLLIDRNGKVAATHVGLVKKAAFERDLRKLLQERANK